MIADFHLTLVPPRDLDAVGEEWRALEARAAPSFFRSWTWVGCRAAERFPDPWLLRAERGGRTVGLALLNRRRLRLWLGESGEAALDRVFVEHNGVLLAAEAADLLAPCLAALLACRRPVRLAGVDAAHLAAAREAGTVRVRRESPAPYVDLAALGPAPEAWHAGLSANTRQQLARSRRSLGPVTLTRAATVAEAWAFLDALAGLHQATWTARGRPGAFADPAFRRFHRDLLARAVPRGEAELLRIDGAHGPIGYLYNFRYRGRVLAYQSGFDYRGGGKAARPNHAKPGLTCHEAAIAQARAEGALVYDFLAGADRYKTSLANAAVPLYWLDAAATASAAGLALRLRGLASTLRNRASWPRLTSAQPNRSA